MTLPLTRRNPPPASRDIPLDTARVRDYTVKPSWMRQLAAFFGLDTVQVEGLGLDYSKWQSLVDAQKAKENGIAFAFIRAAYGTTPDTKFFQHWPGAKGNYLRGLYLYYLNAQDPFQQAQKVYDLCAGDLGEMPPALDLEEYGNTALTALKVQQCLGKLEDLFNQTPIVYTGKNVWDKWFGKNATWGLQYPLWLAQYTLLGWQPDHLTKVLNYPPAIPQPFTAWDFWQFSASCPASLYGVSGTVVDVNYAAPGVLEKYGNPPPVPPPGDEVKQAKCLIPKLNVRNLPAKMIDVGDIVLNEIVNYYPAETVTKPGEEWLHVRKADNTVGWAARQHPDFIGISLELLP